MANCGACDLGIPHVCAMITNTRPPANFNPPPQAVFAQTGGSDLERLIEAINDLADQWDADLQRQYDVNESWTDWHSRALRELLSELDKEDTRNA